MTYSDLQIAQALELTATYILKKHTCYEQDMPVVGDVDDTNTVEPRLYDFLGIVRKRSKMRAS